MQKTRPRITVYFKKPAYAQRQKETPAICQKKKKSTSILMIIYTSHIRGFLHCT
jgi:hypothetical protein